MAFGKLRKQENLDPKNNSNSLYYSVMVKGEGIETLVMTEKKWSVSVNGPRRIQKTQR